MDDNDRLIELMKSLDISARQLAYEIGVRPSTISNLMSRRNRPSLELLQKVVVAFPQVSSEWLFMGKGPMFLQKNDSQGTLDFSQDEPIDYTSADKSDENNAFRASDSSGNYARVVSNGNPSGSAANLQQVQKTLPSTEKSENNPSSFPTELFMQTATRERKIKKVIILFDDNMYDVFDPSEG